MPPLRDRFSLYFHFLYGHAIQYRVYHCESVPYQHHVSESTSESRVQYRALLL